MVRVKLKSFSDLSQLLPPSGKSEHAAAGDTHDGKGKTARISLDTKGRKGKAVTVISGLQHNPDMTVTAFPFRPFVSREMRAVLPLPSCVSPAAACSLFPDGGRS